MSFLLLCRMSVIQSSSEGNLPVVLWHGMGASCCKRGNTNIIQEELEKRLGELTLP